MTGGGREGGGNEGGRESRASNLITVHFVFLYTDYTSEVPVFPVPTGKSD
jgi:hypothetical protein